jgi:hypothetical protein
LLRGVIRSDHLLLLMRLIAAVHDVRVYKPDFCILMVIKERLGGA